MKCTLEKHRTRIRGLLAIIFFSLFVYTVMDSAKVYSILSYQSTREHWEKDFNKRLVKQEERLDDGFSKELSDFRLQLINYQLITNKRIKNLEEDLKEMKIELNKLNEHSEC